ncbi:MAG: hypothetical protein AAFN74_25930 [Myxococcota bacterium]
MQSTKDMVICPLLARLGLVALVLTAFVHCGTQRYVGSIGRDGTYANRGYGFAIIVGRANLARRWVLLDPAKLPLRRTDGLPIPTRDPIDIDGDGFYSVGEATLHFDPTVRLLSQTSTGAVADIRVEVLSGPARDASLEALLQRALNIWTGVPARIRQQALRRAITRKVKDRPAMVTTATSADRLHHVAVIDQGQVRAEENIRRRQLVTIHVYAPQPADARLRDDFGALLDALVLNRKTAPETAREKW